MSNFQRKFFARREKLNSLLCIGLDPEWEKLPHQCLNSQSPLFEFSKSIISATHEYAVAWKPNIAFFERYGSKGFSDFERIIDYCKTTDETIPIIADAKRGDLANTAKEYAKYYFENLKVDALTINAYMGKDTIIPYLDLGGFAFILCLTSNPSSVELQKIKLADNLTFFYEEVSDFSAKLEESYPGQIGIVMGGTHPSELGKIRLRHPNLPFLIPGYGAQGGSLEDIYHACGKNSLINSSRGVTLLSRNDDYKSLASKKASEIQVEFNKLLSSNV